MSNVNLLHLKAKYFPIPDGKKIIPLTWPLFRKQYKLFGAKQNKQYSLKQVSSDWKLYKAMIKNVDREAPRKTVKRKTVKTKSPQKVVLGGRRIKPQVPQYTSPQVFYGPSNRQLPQFTGPPVPSGKIKPQLPIILTKEDLDKKTLKHLEDYLDALLILTNNTGAKNVIKNELIRTNPDFTPKQILEKFIEIMKEVLIQRKLSLRHSAPPTARRSAPPTARRPSPRTARHSPAQKIETPFDAARRRSFPPARTLVDDARQFAEIPDVKMTSVKKQVSPKSPKFPKASSIRSPAQPPAQKIETPYAEQGWLRRFGGFLNAGLLPQPVSPEN